MRRDSENEEEEEEEQSAEQAFGRQRRCSPYIPQSKLQDNGWCSLGSQSEALAVLYMWPRTNAA